LQGEQAEEPWDGAMVPGEQPKQDEEALEGEKVPAAHGAQAGVDGWREK